MTPVETPHNRHVYHLYVVRVPYRDAMRERLTAKGIGTGIHYPIPVHLQNPYKNFHSSPLPVTEKIVQEIISLPMYPELEQEEEAWQVEFPATHLSVPEQ